MENKYLFSKEGYMSKIKLLDCTLRDGGYCNNWSFGEKNIHSIINGLLEANIDIIECGYISQKQECDIDRTQYTSFEQVGKFIPKNREGKNVVAMIYWGEVNIDDIPKYDGTSVDGIRICFHINFSCCIFNRRSYLYSRTAVII